MYHAARLHQSVLFLVLWTIVTTYYLETVYDIAPLDTIGFGFHEYMLEPKR
jgi:hypothetical protein